MLYLMKFYREMKKLNLVSEYWQALIWKFICGGLLLALWLHFQVSMLQMVLISIIVINASTWEFARKWEVYKLRNEYKDLDLKEKVERGQMDLCLLEQDSKMEKIIDDAGWLLHLIAAAACLGNIYIGIVFICITFLATYKRVQMVDFENLEV